MSSSSATPGLVGISEYLLKQPNLEIVRSIGSRLRIHSGRKSHEERKAGSKLGREVCRTLMTMMHAIVRTKGTKTHVRTRLPARERVSTIPGKMKNMHTRYTIANHRYCAVVRPSTLHMASGHRITGIG